jgi:hypothetical protein
MADARSGAPGLPCPGCGERLVATIQQLLSGTPIVCQCGLELHVDEQQSRETLDGLRRLQARLSASARSRNR